MPEPETSHVRLNKYLAHQFGLSRRQADEAITGGQVQVNNQLPRLGTIIKPMHDSIVYNGRSSNLQHRYTYIILNKPVGYVCSRAQQGSTPTIYSLLPRHWQNLKPAGRLDKDSCGLVLLTDDGDTIFALTHPKFSKLKRYQVGLNKPLKPEDITKLNRGLTLDDGPSQLQVEHLESQKKPNLYQVSMREGRNRQIRRSFLSLGYSVTHLERSHLGPYSLKGLASGQTSPTTRLGL